MYAKNYIRKSLLFTFVICHSSFVICFAQLQVTPNNNAAALAGTLAGPGVTVSNATMNCPSTANDAAGTFVGTASNIGISSGVLLTTGSVNNAVGPNLQSGITTANGVSFFDPDLMTIDPNATNDVCILEFDAIPTCDTLAFTFAFGSDEYPEFVNSIYNDAFGIFVTGTNPAGPPYTGYNMARIPVSLVPVSINNVNNGTVCPTTGPCVNCAYYVDNCTGATVEYDGFTTPITVTLNVVPCSSYHFKLAIADAGDQVLDSGVFFELQSLLCSSSLTINIQSTNVMCSVAGTATATVTGGAAPYTYTWSTLPPQTTQTATGLAAGTYTVSVIDANGCLSGTQTVTIAQIGGFSVTPTQSNVTCFGSNNGSATVTPSTGGTPPYTYLWNTNPPQTTPTISNIPAGNYTVNITDATGCTQTQTFSITQPTALTVTTTVVSNVSCNGGSDGSASATSSGGTSPYTYWWTPSGQTVQNVTGLFAGTYSAVVTDSNGCPTTAPVTITEPTGMSVNIVTTPTDCGIQTGSATASVSGGTSPYTYQWQTNPIQTGPAAVNLGAGNYVVTIVDANGCPTQQSFTVPSLSLPGANFYYDPTEISMLDPMTLFFDASAGNITQWYWDFGDPVSGQNNFSIQQNPTHSFSDTGTYCVQLLITDAGGVCRDSIVKCLRVVAPFTLYVPNAFSPNSDGLNEFFMAYGTFITEFKFWLFDRWGQLIWSCETMSEPQLSDICKWDGKVLRNGETVQEDVYVWKAFIVDVYGRKKDFIGHLTVVR